MESLICTDTELLNLDPGKHELPLLIEIEKGKTTGYVFLTKISIMFRLAAVYLEIGLWGQPRSA